MALRQTTDRKILEDFEGPTGPAGTLSRLRHLLLTNFNCPALRELETPMTILASLPSSPSRPGFRPVAALLVLLAAGPWPAWSMDPQGSAAGAILQAAAESADQVFKPGAVCKFQREERRLDGLASLGGEGVFILGGGQTCTACPTGRSKKPCRHIKPSSLTYLYPLADSAGANSK